MNLVGYTATALSRNDIEDTPTNKNVVDFAIVELKDLQGNLVVMYDDAEGLNPETQKTCDTDGLCTFFTESGDYILRVNGRESRVSLGITAESLSEATDLAVEESTAIATDAASRAEAYADAASASGNIYADTASGLAATVDGDYFSVVSSYYSGYLDLYLNNAGSAIFQKQYPSSGVVRDLNEKFSSASQEVYNAAYPTVDAVFSIVNDDAAIRDFESTFSGWKLPYFYSGETISVLRFEVNLEGQTNLKIQILDGNNVVKATAYTCSSVSGYETVVLSTPLTAADITTEVFYVSVTSNFDDNPPVRMALCAASEWESVDRPNPTTYPAAFTTTSGPSQFSNTSTGNPSYALKIRLYSDESTISEKIDGINQLISSNFTTLDNKIADNFNAISDQVTNIDYTSKSSSVSVVQTSSFARDVPFAGFAADYNKVQGESFNLLRISQLKRAIPKDKSDAWAKFTVSVFNISGAQLTKVAHGENLIPVDETQTEVSNLEFTLKDPSSGEIITLDDVILSNTYRVAYHAYNTQGQLTAVGETRGTAENYAGASFFTTTTQDESSFSTLSGNPAVPVERFLAQGLVDSIGVTVKESVLPESVFQPPVHIPEILVAKKYYSVEGMQNELYFDNMLAEYVNNYSVDLVGDPLLRQMQRSVLIRSDLTAGSYNFSVSLKDKRTEKTLVQSESSDIILASTNAKSGVNVNVMAIGDSLVASGSITQTLIDNASTDQMDITLHGTIGSGVNKHEGRGGWRVSDYTTSNNDLTYIFTVSGITVEPSINSTEYSVDSLILRVQEKDLSGGDGTLTCSVVSGSGAPPTSGTLSKTIGDGDQSISYSSVMEASSNPFFVNGSLDFGAYQSNNSIPQLDYVFIALGINDVFNASTDDQASSIASNAAAQLESLISSIRTANPSCKIAIALPTPPADQNAFGSNYTSSQYAARDKRNVFFWNKSFNSSFGGREVDDIYVMPSYAYLDTMYNYPTSVVDVNSRNSKKIEIQNNGVHPALSGYQQIGDSWFSFIKAV